MFLVLAIKYDIESSNIPNDLFKCTHYECNWGYYTKGKDWDFYTNNGRNISGCRDCMKICEADPKCKSLECGEDQPLPDGTTKYAHCSWWSEKACYKHEDFTLNPNNYILTCRRKGL